MTSAASDQAVCSSSPPRVRLVTVEQLQQPAEGPTLRLPTAAARCAWSLLLGKDREHFVAMHLDTRHRVVSVEIVSMGTLSSSLVHPREVFKGAILANAAAIICAHNHPSGDVSPSQEDRALLKRVLEAGQLLGIPLLDFLIVSETEHWSASEHGLMRGGASA